MTGETDFSILLASMAPELDDRDVVFAIASTKRSARIDALILLSVFETFYP